MRIYFWFWMLLVSVQLLPYELYAGSSQNKKEDEPADFYEAIATREYLRRNATQEENINPPVLPAEPVFGYNGAAPFKPMDKLDTQEEVNKGLADLRKKYEPFLRDLTPPAKKVRLRLPITKMQFRYETSEDRADINRVLSGQGKWKDVEIPYYHGPQGPSTAYYRTEVEVSDELLSSDLVMLHFNGADYYCDAFVNGHHIGFHEGMLDPFEFNAKPYLKKGKNVILVKLRNDYSMLGSEGARYFGNKIAACNSPGWDDPMTGWNCCPAGYGLYQDIYLESRSHTYIADIFPRPLLKEKSIELWVETDMPNGRNAGEFTLRATIYGQNFQATVVENALKKRRLAGGRCIEKWKIKIPDELFRLWTPGEPWLYQARVELLDAKKEKVLDSKSKQFGMRSFVISTKSTPKGRMYLNGKEIRLRGCNTMGFLQKDTMAHNWNRLIDDLLLAKLTNMNFIRTTQRSLQDEVYQYADKLGMMMQSDLPLFGYVNHKQFGESVIQAGRMERLLRSHPSVILITYMNESLAGHQPNTMTRAEYEKLFDAADYLVRHENPDRAIKDVDGDYQPPSKGLPDNHCYNIWYHGHGGNLGRMHRGGWCRVKKNWMYGCGEFGAEGLDSVDLMLKYYPPKWLPKDKNPDNQWTPALIRTAFKSNQTAGKSWQWFEQQNKMADWVRESRRHQAWGVKMIAETFRRMPRMNTFAVHLFIDAWPNGWMKAIVDADRVPKPAWYAYRDALTPLAVQIRTDKYAFFSGDKYNLEIWVCNDTSETPDAEIRYQIEKEDGTVIASGRDDAQIPTVTQGSHFQGYLPITAPDTDKRTKIIARVGLFDKKTGKQLHEYSQPLDIYPPVTAPENKKLFLVGAESPSSKEIADAFSLEKTDSLDGNPLILITDYAAYNANRAKIDAAVKNGARAIVLFGAIPSDKGKAVDICGTTIKPENRRKPWSLWFIGRAKNNPLAMKGTTSVDFKFLYSSATKAPRMNVFTTFTAKEMKPVLISNKKNIVAEQKIDKGHLIVCQLDLKGRLCNPSLKSLLRELLFNTAE